MDASDEGIGIVLLQKDDERIEKTQHYFSKKLNNYQKNYSTIGKECLALSPALQCFQVYLSVTLHPIIVYTDHNPLNFLQKKKNGKQKSKNHKMDSSSSGIQLPYKSLQRKRQLYC